jgi:hypothetical protein
LAKKKERWSSNVSDVEESKPVVQLVTTRSDTEIAADIKRRLLEAFKPVLEIFDEASTSGLAIQWDNIKPVSPRYKHEVNGLRVVKYL